MCCVQKQSIDDKVAKFLTQKDCTAALNELVLPSSRHSRDKMLQDLGSHTLKLATVHHYFGHTYANSFIGIYIRTYMYIYMYSHYYIIVLLKGVFRVSFSPVKIFFGILCSAPLQKFLNEGLVLTDSVKLFVMMCIVIGSHLLRS